ncbi:MAG: insulinase family protein [Candidatus Portnoybacteria bacterium]|nr:insulinase family protein [Candidatus Portnoybacteria bacterium]
MRRLDRYHRRSPKYSGDCVSYEIIQKVLPSGLTVILAPRQGTSIVSEVFVVRAGGRYETPEMCGISHFLEHMMSKGTKRRPTALDITREFDATGGEHNAFTSAEMMYFFLSADAIYTELIHDLLSDRILQSQFAPEAIESEKGVIIEEIRTSKDDVSANLAAHWFKLLYGNQPAGRDFIGTEKTIKAMRREHLRNYMEKLYVASNSAVCVAGRIPDPVRAFEDIEKFFAGMSRATPGLLMAPVVERQRKPALLLNPSPIGQASILLGVRTYGLTHPDHSVLRVIAALLGGYTSSRIYLELRERGLVYEAGMSIESQADIGDLAAYANLKKGHLIEGLRIIMYHYRSMAAGEFSEGEVRCAKSYLIGSRKMDLENSCDMAMDLAAQFALCGKALTFEERDRRIEAVTPADVQRVARDIFINEKLNLAIAGPYRRGLEEKIAKILSF